MRVALFNNSNPVSVELAGKVRILLEKAGIMLDNTHPDLVITIGGDGTLLSAFHKYQAYLNTVRFVGIHTGHLGFYTDWRDYEVEELVESLKKDKGESVSYPLLDIRVKFSDEDYYTTYIALNEAVLKKLDGTMVCDIYIKDELFETFRGDGVCLSTPTGSTGLSKSLGGAVIHPRTEALQLTEMASVNNRIFRTLSSPMIIARDEWVVIYPKEEDELIFAIDNLPYQNRKIERIIYRIAKEKVHFARYRHMHFWNRVEDAFIGSSHQDLNSLREKGWMKNE